MIEEGNKSVRARVGFSFQRWENASQSQLKKIKKIWAREQFKKESQIEREVSA